MADQRPERPDNWFVAQLKPNSLRIAQQNLARQGFDHFTPLRLERVASRARIRSEPKPLFPGYIFVCFDPAGPDWRRIPSTRGLTRLILNDPRQPRPLPRDFMAELLQRCDASGLLQAPESLAVGDRVRVLDGPFAETISRIEALAPDRRIQVLVELMGRHVRVQIPAESVGKL